MNHIVIDELSEFATIIVIQILLIGQSAVQEEEIYENMWAISLGENFAFKISRQELVIFY